MKITFDTRSAEKLKVELEMLDFYTLIRKQPFEITQAIENVKLQEIKMELIKKYTPVSSHYDRIHVEKDEKGNYVLLCYWEHPHNGSERCAVFELSEEDNKAYKELMNFISLLKHYLLQKEEE